MCLCNTDALGNKSLLWEKGHNVIWKGFISETCMQIMGFTVSNGINLMLNVKVSVTGQLQYWKLDAPKASIFKVKLNITQEHYNNEFVVNFSHL